jgi:hypothetical protein
MRAFDPLRHWPAYFAAMRSTVLDPQCAMV